MRRLRLLRYVFAVLLTVTMLGALQGCVTAPDSDLPWNTRQSWEGTSLMPPGMQME